VRVEQEKPQVPISGPGIIGQERGDCIQPPLTIVAKHMLVFSLFGRRHVIEELVSVGRGGGLPVLNEEVVGAAVIKVEDSR
jgi:hypothetical protein